MLKNYFKIAFRRLIRNKSYAFISVFGLAIGLCVCILLLLYVEYELSYDRFHKNAAHIYRLCQKEHPYHAPQTAKLIADNLPEINNYARILVRGELIVQYGDKKFKETEFAMADASLFNIFSFQFKHGNPKTALQQPLTVVISEKIAQKYFGHENPIGKILKLDNKLDYTITGIIKDMPQNSHFLYDIIASLTNSEDLFGADRMASWGWENFLVYFQISEDFNQKAIEQKSNQIIAQHRGNVENSDTIEFSIQALTDIHLYSAHFDNDIQPQNSITYVLIFSAIGILILLIACFNYINMATANATARANEIGIKKVVGASRSQLVKQFIGESLIIIFMSFFISLLLVEICLPLFNDLSGKLLSSSSLFQLNTIIGIISILFITGILAGGYPAFFLSSLQPARTLKTKSTIEKSKFHIRKILVGIQFAIVIILIICALLMYNQIDFLQEKNLGFDKEYVLISEVEEFTDIEKYNSLKQALLGQSMVSDVSCASRVPSDDLNNHGALKPQGRDEYISLPFIHMSYDYFNVLGIKASQGRLYSSDIKSDMNDAIIINEAAVELLELKGDPIGQSMYCVWPQSDRKIIGIVKDFHFESLYDQIQPAAFVIYHNMCWKLLVKVRPSNVKNAISSIQDICQSFYPDQIFEFQFLDNKLEYLYRNDQNTFRLMGYFTALAIIIACSGLFGMASFLIKCRTKEIGIRRTLGASIPQILMTLSSDFTKWVLIANIFAWPVAWYAMNGWLQNFAYRINIGYWVFFLSGILALIFALMTISIQATKTATSNPVDALKYE